MNVRKPFAAGLLVLALGSAAWAQQVSATGGRVAGTFGGSFGDGGSTIAAAGSAGIRVTRHLGLDFEVMVVPNLRLPRELAILRWAPIRLPLEQEGRLIGFLSRWTVEFPVGNRLWPYLTGGGGPVHLKQVLRFRGPVILERIRLGERAVFPESTVPIRDFEVGELGLGLTIGGGVDVGLWRGLAVGVDARYLRVLGGTQNPDLGQVTARLSYRF